jgi:hypothetical protein
MKAVLHALPALALLASVAIQARAADDPRLIPKPREITAGALAPLTRQVVVESAANDDDRFAARDLIETLKERGLKAVYDGRATGYHVVLHRLESTSAKSVLKEHNLEFTTAMRAEGYVIVAEKSEAHVIGATANGVFYGAQTIKQLIRTDGEQPRIHLATIRDWPAMPYRGFQDDLSRGPVPTLEFQKKQIRTYATYKLNFFSPYFEQSLAYRSNPLLAPPVGAMSREDVKALVAYARRYHVDVIPEQEAFGHLHHMLKYELYATLAETPHGHVLSPGQPGSIALIKQLFAEIDTLFPSKFVHIGADETFELGRGQTKDRMTKEGEGVVYLDFLKQIEAALRPNGKKLLFWADIAEKHPELVKSLPKDMIAVAWDYWSTKGFERKIKPFTDAGIETWVAPGVGSWNRVYPNNDVALRNIQGFIRDGQHLGATGVLNTSWDDDGEAIFNQTWYGILFGAAASWQKGEASIDDFRQAFGLQFHGDASGRIDSAQQKLSDAHALLAKAGLGEATNELYWVDPYHPEGQLLAEKMRIVSREYRVLVEQAMVLIAQAREGKLREPAALDAMEMGARRMDFIGMKFQLADEIVRLYAQATDPASTEPPGRFLDEISSRINGRTQDIRDGYVLGRELYEKSWLAENRPYWLGNVSNRYDLAAQLWIGRADRFLLLRKTYARTQKLPSAEEMGIPKAMPAVVP